MEKKCDLCGKDFKQGDTVHQHVLEDEDGYAAAGMDLCDDCDGKKEYHYGTSEYEMK